MDGPVRVARDHHPRGATPPPPDDQARRDVPRRPEGAIFPPMMPSSVPASSRAQASPRRVARTPTPPIPRPGSFRPGGGRRAHAHTARRCPVPSSLAPRDSVGSQRRQGRWMDGDKIPYFRTHRMNLCHYFVADKKKSSPSQLAGGR